MGKTRKRGGSRRKRGGAFQALQGLINATHANLKKAADKAKEAAATAHRDTMGMIDKAHAEGTAALPIIPLALTSTSMVG